MATVVATGVTAEGNREVLGCDVGDSETEAFWQQFLGGLRDRGLAGVRLVISDAHRGLSAAADRWFQGAARQRCGVHFIRNLLALVPKSHQHMAAAVCRTIFAQPDAGAVADAWTRSPTSSPPGSPRQAHSWTPPRPTCWPSPPSPGRTGRRSGPPTPSNASTRG